MAVAHTNHPPPPFFSPLQTLAHVLDLVYHPALFSAAWRQAVTSAAAALLPFSPSPSAFTPAQLTALAMRVNCNAHSLVSVCGNSSSVGLGLYPRVSTLNHSCVPSCHYTTARHGVMEVRARTALQEGDELSVHYTDLYESREERGRQLMRDKGFLCSCSRCTEDIRSSVDRIVGGVYCACNQRTKQPQASISAGPKRAGVGDAVSRAEVAAEMAVPPSSAPLIVFIGDLTKPADDARRDYQCLFCGRKSSAAAVTALLQPLLLRHQAAVQHRQGGRLQQAMEGLEELLSFNRSHPTTTPFHPLLLSSYVLLFNLSMHLSLHSTAARYARHIVHAYRTVFPADFSETGDWLYAEALACDKAWKEWKGRGGSGGVGGRGGGGVERGMERRWKEERNVALRECEGIRDVCCGPQQRSLSPQRLQME